MTTEDKSLPITMVQRAEITELLRTFSLKEIAAKYNINVNVLYHALAEPKKRERARRILRVELGKKKTSILAREASKRNISTEVLAAKLLACIIDGDLFRAVLDDDGSSKTIDDE
jgi:hypothetical protein